MRMARLKNPDGSTVSVNPLNVVYVERLEDYLSNIFTIYGGYKTIYQSQNDIEAELNAVMKE